MGRTESGCTVIRLTTHRGTPLHDVLLDAYQEAGLVCESYLVAVYDAAPTFRGTTWYRIVDLAPGQDTWLWQLVELTHVGEA